MAMTCTHTPFAYRPGRTILHRINAAIKLIGVIIISVAAFSSIYGLAAAILLILSCTAIARIHPRELFKGSKPLVVLSVFIIIVKILQPHSGLLDGCIIVLRIFTTFAVAACFFAVTGMRELRMSLAALELAVKKILFPRRASLPFFSLGICLMLGFIPRFFELWESSLLACRARACKRRIGALYILIPLVIERMMEAAAETAQALEARGITIR